MLGQLRHGSSYQFIGSSFREKPDSGLEGKSGKRSGHYMQNQHNIEDMQKHAGVRTLLGAKGIATRSKEATSSYLLLVLGPGAPSSILVPSSDALCS